MWMAKLRTSKDYSIEYDKRKKMSADVLMAICGLISGGLMIAGANFLLTGDVLSFGKNMPDFLNKIMRWHMLKEPVVHNFFEDDGRLSATFIAALVLGAALIIWAFAAAFIKNKRLGITVLCFYLTFSVLASLLYPTNITQRMDYRVNEAINSAGEMIEAVRFNKGEPICEGDFALKKGAGLTGEPALNIIMQNPQQYYLRGFVGEQYNGSGWEKTDPAALLEYNDVFMELHGAGFDGRNMMAAINEIIKPGGETQKIQIKNTGCNKKYFYLPYETVKLDNESVDYIGDACYISDIPENGESYGFYAEDYSVDSVTDMKNNLADRQRGTQAADFLKNEYNYRLFCRENYTGLPEETVGIIAGFLETTKKSYIKKLPSVSEIKKIILEGTRGFKYNETVIYSVENGDFINDFLENKCGYSIHFSTLAAAVFRYYGVPARFAEGYLVTDKDVEGKEANEVIELTQSAYHTWMEYYEDGIGWVPFEATPKYIGVMKSDNNISSAGTGGVTEQEKRPTPEKPKHNLLINKEGEINKTASILLILIVILALYISYKLLRRIMNKNRRIHTFSFRDINSGDNKRAIFAIMHYIRRTEKRYSLDLGFLAEAREIYEEAKYSDHEITAEKSAKMKMLYSKLKKTRCKRAAKGCETERSGEIYRYIKLKRKKGREI